MVKIAVSTTRFSCVIAQVKRLNLLGYDTLLWGMIDALSD
jgi:hypothetical protein